MRRTWPVVVLMLALLSACVAIWASETGRYALSGWAAGIIVAALLALFVAWVSQPRTPGPIQGGDPFLRVKEELLRRIADDLAAGRPAGEVAAFLDGFREEVSSGTGKTFERLKIAAPDFDARLADVQAMMVFSSFLDEQAGRIVAAVRESLLEARELERNGDLDAALPLYERCIRDKFTGSLPYDRLRIIYTRQHRYTEAIRVCDAYLALPDRSGMDRPGFEHHRTRLQSKLAKSTG